MPRVQHSDLVSIDALNGLRDAVETQGLSDPQVVQATTGMQPQFLTTVSVQRPARVFRVLCWNTLVYNYSKAMHNPFVNAVLGRVLGALGVDMAILLETRENPSVSLAALEEGKVLDVYREPKEETTEMDDEPEGDDDEPEGGDDEPEGDDEVDDDVGGILPSPPRMTSYQWIASETTGRTQMPPAELHLPNPEIKPYHQQYKGHRAPRRLMNKVSAGTDPKGNDREWKQACRDYLLRYYDCTWRDRHVLESLQAVSLFRFQGDETVEFRPRVCPTCGKPQGYAGWPCGRCDRPQGGKAGRVTRTKAGKPLKRKSRARCPARTHKADPCVTCGKRVDKALEWIRWLRYLQPRGGETYAPNYRFSVDELFGMYNIERGGALAGVLEYFDCVVWSAPRAIGPDQLEQITPAMEPGIALTLKKCGTCQQQVGRQKAPCDACKDYHPRASATQTLIVSLAGVLKFMQHLETYAVLVKQQGVPSGDDPQRPITTGPRLEVYPGEVMVAVHRTGCDLVSTDPLGREVGFRDAHSFHSNGRCPYVIPLEIVPYDAPGEDPVLLWMMAFHAPFSGGEAMRARALDKAMTIGLVPALTDNVGKTAFGELDRAVLIGDLNLDYRPGGSTGSAPNQWYSSMQGRGFAVGIPGVRTSLKKILKGAKARTFHEEWKNDYRSSAYDNVLMRGSWADRGVLQCAVVDVVAWIEANLQDFPLPTGCPAQDVRYFNGLSSRERAIFIYQMFVSDHLPVVIDILVKPLSLDALAAIRKMDTQRREQFSRTVMRRLVMMWEQTVFLHPLALIGAGAYASGPDITLLVGAVAGVDGANVVVVGGERRAIFKFGEVAPPRGTTVVLGYLNPTFEGEVLVGQPDFVDYVLPKDEKIRCIDSRRSLWFMAATVIEQGRDRFFRMQAGQVTSGLAFVKPGWDPPPRDGDTVVVLFREPRQVVA